MLITYPVIFTETNDNKETVLIEVPDIAEALSEGFGMKDAIEMAKDLICEILYDLQDEGEAFPVPSEPEEIDIEEGRFFDAGVSQIIEVTVEIEDE